MYVCVVGAGLAEKKKGGFRSFVKNRCDIYWAMPVSHVFVVHRLPYSPPPPLPNSLPRAHAKNKTSRSEKGLVAQSKISFLCRDRCVAQSKKRARASRSLWHALWPLACSGLRLRRRRLWGRLRRWGRP